MKKAAFAILAVLISSNSFAEQRKIDFTSPLKDERGETIRFPEGQPRHGEAYTLGEAVARALLYDAPQKPSQRSELLPTDYLEKAKRAQLALRLATATDAELTAEEATKIKAAAGAVYSPIMVLRIVEAIDPASLR